MDQLTRLLSLDLDIRLNDPVRRVEWRRGFVRVTTDGVSHEADAVVVTIPVGMLARGAIEFAPALSPEKIAAARRLPMGLLNKAYVRFPRTFWETELDFLTFHANPPPLFYAWLNLYRYTGEPALIGFTSGSMARQVEIMTDAQVRDRIFARLRAARQGALPEPLEVRASHWASDPWAQGSYSFLGLGATPDDRVTLGTPVENTLFFAGEATHRDDPSSVHGAWWSGLRAAKEVLGEA
jgi:monoamine oxidase